ncbi:Ada metal-binding domain-containing protein [Collimonas sp.]|jgi:methylphosphotriester-DNA--protein-cysteine methyltransferase|uniref:Ada metal-binding domain-containing protein n=1 Tax=Collimonas sp. TaxID=1963772 RepID=UPI002D1973BE|nr:Ada metal-binding domain-containing protein [Collimonas sp.]HWW03742.1 Ada metal-binding domain-containing protein [Collimonas sp.]
MNTVSKQWRLIGADGGSYDSDRPGQLGGHRRSRIYGRLDCRAALQAIAKGGYVKNRVFFLNRADAQAAGYRPCAVCLPQDYACWKAQKNLAASSQ